MQMTLVFFLRNEKSATEVIKTFDKFSLFSGLKINNAKCEIAGIGVKKGVKMAVCVTQIPTSTINLLAKIEMEFIWKGKNPKIKNSTLCNDYEYGGLKNVDIFSKVVSLQCSWIKRLFDNNFHQWKLIPLYLIRQYLGKNFKFHSNLEISHSILCKFPKFYKEIFIRWGKHLSSPATLPSTISSQFVWYNKHIQTDNKSIYLYNFSNMNLNFVGQLINTDGKLKPWEGVKQHAVLILANYTW